MAAAGVMMIAAFLYVRRSLSRPLLGLAGYMRQLATNDMDNDIQGTERCRTRPETARPQVLPKPFAAAGRQLASIRDVESTQEDPEEKPMDETIQRPVPARDSSVNNPR